MTTTKGAEEKVAIARRLREMLLRQREKFQAYLDLLESEGSAIASGDVDMLRAQLEMERCVIAEIHTLRRVIEPLEDLYRAAYPEREDTVPPLKAALEKMGTRMKERNAANRAALRAKMEELRKEIEGMQMWPRSHHVFVEPAPSLVDITA
jgi:hypothetical protein